MLIYYDLFCEGCLSLSLHACGGGLVKAQEIKCPINAKQLRDYGMPMCRLNQLLIGEDIGVYVLG